MLTLLLAAISSKNRGECKGYEITIKGVQNNFFIDKKDVEDILVKSTSQGIKGQPISSFKLHELEQLLEQNTWIDAAELYFDNKDILHVTVSEKEPVARVFTIAGNSFYIDSAGKKMPLSDKLSARVPVFTGYPDKKKLNGIDSMLLNDVRKTANYIINHPFWMAQVSQININAQRNFEMVPVVGNHMVKLGNGDDIERKFHRLMVFYRQVLSKTGFDKYKLIDVQYRGQVVASRYAGDPKVDSVQLKKNVEKLLRQSIEAETDTVVKMMPQLVTLEADSAMATDPSLDGTDDPNPLKLSSPLPEKPNPATAGKADMKTPEKPKTTTPAKPKPVKSETPKPVKNDRNKPATNRQPKAVMPKKPVKAESEYEGYN